MATAAQIQTILANLIATLTTLSADAAQSVTAANRAIVLKRMAEVRQEIEAWEAKLAVAHAGGSARPYVVQFQDAGP